MSRTQRLVVLGLAALVLVIGGIVAASSGGSSQTSSGPATVEVRDAKPVGGVQDLTFRKGGTIDLTVRSDTADEIHVHGYDRKQDVRAGGSVRFRFPATIDGRFIVELEQHGETLANVTVTP